MHIRIYTYRKKLYFHGTNYASFVDKLDQFYLLKDELSLWFDNNNHSLYLFHMSTIITPISPYVYINTNVKGILHTSYPKKLQN